MEFRELGKTGIQLSVIGFGCMSLGKIGEAEATNLIHAAIDQGINYFDTADIYDKGANETLVGGALQAKRKEVVLATKVGNMWRADGSGLDWNPTKAHILKSVEESLRRLQTDYIDLYQLHGGTIDDPIDETIEAFELLKAQGKILHYGISSIRPNVIREYVKRSAIVSVMMQYSLLDTRPEEAVLDLLAENKISVLARGVLAQGLLVDKPAAAYLQHSAAQVETVQKMMLGIKEGPTAAAIQYVLSAPAVSSAVIGVRTAAQLQAAVGAVGSYSNEIARLRAATPKITYKDHR